MVQSEKNLAQTKSKLFELTLSPEINNGIYIISAQDGYKSYNRKIQVDK